MTFFKNVLHKPAQKMPEIFEIPDVLLLCKFYTTRATSVSKFYFATFGKEFLLSSFANCSYFLGDMVNVQNFLNRRVKFVKATVSPKIYKESFFKKYSKQ